jgi:hypothetical protein
MFIDVLTEEGTILAKVLTHDESTYTIRYLTFKNGYYRYEPSCEISVESISGFYEDTQTEESLGYTKVGTNKFTLEDDEYEPSDEDYSSDSTSLSDSFSSPNNSDIDS